jgi:hypothetical protein
MKKPKTLSSVVSSRLARLRAGSVVMRFEPPLICDCGGEVEVKDWRGEASKGGRYEAWCNGCKSCDPNGWASQREVLANSPGYFHRQCINSEIDLRRKISNMHDYA